MARPAWPPHPPASPLARRGVRAGGFTLIELLAVVGFTAVLLVFAANFYLEITRASGAATARTRDSRRAVALLDRVARDLEATVLVRKPEGVDPLFHPWVFLAEDRDGEEGAEHLKFVTRSRVLRSTALHESDLEMVSYALREGEDGGLELLRWSSPRLPEELDRSFPAGEAEGTELFAADLASFGVRLMNDSGEWVSEWDSSTLIDSSELPVAAEISVAVLPEGDPLAEPAVYLRRVLIPVRPLDLEALLGIEKESDEEDEEDDDQDSGMTVGECIERNQEAFAALEKDNPELASVIESLRDQPFSKHADAISGIGLVGCE
jgi:type II secretory pathway component PulJ